MPSKTDLQSTDALLNELQDLQNEIQNKKQAGGKKRGSKKGSKKASKKGSKKGSKKDKMSRTLMVIEGDMLGGKKRSKKASKNDSKKGSKKGSLKGGKGGKGTLNSALKATQLINEKILKASGAERKFWFGLITYVNTLRKEAKKKVKDETDFDSVNKKILELFEIEIEKKGKDKIAKAIEDFYVESMAKRRKRGSKK